MSLTGQIAKLLRDVHFGGNWVASSLKEHLADVTWEQATTSVYALNSIATLVFHMNYYLNAVSGMLERNELTAKHKYSLEATPVTNEQDWQQMLDKTWADAEKFAKLIEQLPEEKLWETFFEDKYGNYYRNIHGVIEHCHYHLGQIVLIKKVLSGTR
jgi:hypothetical protein